MDPNTFIIVALLSNNTVRNKLIHLPFSVDQGMMQKLSALFNAGFTGLTDDKISPHLISATERAACDNMGLTSVLAAFTIESLTSTHSSEAFVTGESSLLRQPEFRDPEKAHRVMSYLSDAGHLLNLPETVGEQVIRITTGRRT